MTLGYYLSSPWLVVAVATPAEGLTNAKETATVQDGTNESDATTGTNAIREVIQGKPIKLNLKNACEDDISRKAHELIRHCSRKLVVKTNCSVQGGGWDCNSVGTQKAWPTHPPLELAKFTRNIFE